LQEGGLNGRPLSALSSHYQIESCLPIELRGAPMVMFKEYSTGYKNLKMKREDGILVSTMVADYGAAGMSLYGSSKAAINLLTKAWAAEYGPSGVRVNTVSPGPTRTEGTQEMGEGVEQLAA